MYTTMQQWDCTKAKNQEVRQHIMYITKSTYFYVDGSGYTTQLMVPSTMGWIRQSVWMLDLVLLDAKQLLSRISHFGM